MQQTNEPASIPDSLLVPDDFLARPRSRVLGFRGVFGRAEGLVGFADGEDEQEGVGGAGHEGEEVWVGDAEDVVELEGGGEAEFVEEGGHYFGVVFWVGRVC